MYVPCGKCEACRNARANDWVNRLRSEAKCWKYVLFFTLTYQFDKRPCFTVYDNRIFIPQLSSVNPELEPAIIDLDYEYQKYSCSVEWQERNNAWIKSVCSLGSVPHLSKYHVQLFVKRLRKNLKNLIIKQNEKYSAQDYLVRYFICGEYGETAYAPHYHGLLFFQSDKEYKAIQKALSKSWTLGIVDSSLVRSDAASYVASYLNSFAYLPQVLQHPCVRPFCLASKSTPIGLVSVDDEEIREIFYNSSISRIQPAADGKSFVDVPIWNTIKNRLFPRIALFSRVIDTMRTQLYSAVSRFEKFSGKEACVTSFVNYVLYCYNHHVTNVFFNSNFSSYIDSLVSLGYDELKLTNSLVHLFYISNRVALQSVIYGVTIPEYVQHIVKFYDNVEKANLKKYFEFQDEFNIEYSNSSLVGLDLNFLYSIVDADISDVSAEEISLLESFGVDIDKFFNADLSVRYGYIERLLPQNQIEFRHHKSNQELIAKHRVKNKRKNDYLDNLSYCLQNDIIKALASF